MIQNELYTALKSLVSGRCFYEVIPETNTEYPVIVYQFPNISPNSALIDSEMDDYTVQIDIYSHNPDDIFRLRKQVIEVVEDTFNFAERVADFSDYEAETKLHRRMFTYQIAYED
ncbi:MULTISPECIES: DUF3168 domain-containing protein [unclassified Mannheimia]|uniref:DUF3168 domain-containing protein n=1 Tax=unclassified Mannheimia TaxID=2645054 RepID=UPI00359CE531